MVNRPPHRPTILTILAVLSIIGGVISIVIGLAALAAGGLAELSGSLSGRVSADVAGVFLFVAGIAALLGGIISLMFGIGTLEDRHWAWTLGIASQILSLIGALFAIITGAVHSNIGSAIAHNIINILIALAILYYLNTPRVRGYYERGAAGQPPQVPSGRA